MTLKLYYHPLSSFCWKALVALYENATPFEPVLVNLQDPAERAAFAQVWPLAKFPVLRDEAQERTVPESTIIVEYLDQHYPGATKLLPADPDRARQTRMTDRFLDLHIHMHMQKVTGDRLRPKDKRDPFGVEHARAAMRQALGMMEDNAGAEWLMGEDFTLADCAAAPALFYASKIVTLGPEVSAYLERLKARPSFARVLKEAEPYFHMFPADDSA